MKQLHVCLEQIAAQVEVELVTLTCDDLGYKTPNFTTSGIYHLHGLVKVENHHQQPWSIIVKVIKPDSNEKDDLAHHNYWRREALIFESGLLEELPESIATAKCYLIEEQEDDHTIWLWMEHIEGQYAQSQEQFDLIARQLGRFNGAYLGGKTLPDQEWICRGWLRSWTTACKKYAPNPGACLDALHRDIERSIWTWFQDFNEKIDKSLTSLDRLPRVLAHQDLSQMNIFLVNKDSEIDRVILIDWQFLSISGIGEDLAKMFGVNMSLGIIPVGHYRMFQASLFQAYITGLRDMGWEGDERLARYGYCIGTALRSVWEVPKYISLVVQPVEEPQTKQLRENVVQLEEMIKVQMEMALEAETLGAILF